MGLKQLGVVTEIIESAGLSITYAYEDLVFLEHNAFLLQFTDENDKILIHINQDANKDAIQDAISIIRDTAKSYAMTFIDGSNYSLSQADDENLHIEFFPETL